MRIRNLLIVLFFSPFFSSGQQAAFARTHVDTLASAYFWGRGYVKEGMQKAAGYISEQFRSYGLSPFTEEGFLQHFTYPVNTFPGAMELILDKKKLIPGVDFLVMPESVGAKASGRLLQSDSLHFVDRENGVIVQLTDKLTWSVSEKAFDYCAVQVLKSSLESSPDKYRIHIENKWLENFRADNVCAYVKGKEVPDSFIFITAHYDHLGGMGSSTYFPGANDNASGVSLLLNLARHYSMHPQRYSIGFICFAGEEAGLAGSKYYTENPMMPLDKIRFLLNTDLAGTGEEGITVVNATEFPKEFALLKGINDTYHLLPAVKERGKAANSDHYFFSEKGVPAFFFYTMGGIKAYHDIFDRPETLPLQKIEELFELVIKFSESIQ